MDLGRKGLVAFEDRGLLTRPSPLVFFDATQGEGLNRTSSLATSDFCLSSSRLSNPNEKKRRRKTTNQVLVLTGLFCLQPLDSSIPK